ncbi:MAG: Gfo/Idh/MocA family oxidoreductase [Acidimicrobiaceae bacterium]|nr:Gfo/Idh/MocA family oxidoreductase [Acidimicrobiaceae bacterium]
MSPPVRLGIIGFGLATGPVVGPLTTGGRFDIVGCADPDPLSRDRFTGRFSKPAFEAAPDLLENVQLDAVYIATPTRLHEELACLSFDHGIHVLVEKPIAPSLAAAEGMIAAASRAGLTLMVNHKRSADRDILGMWQLSKNDTLGKVRAVHRWQFSDWFYRARAEDERDPEAGGVVLRQGAHEFDVLRLLLPSTPVRLRGITGDYDGARPGEGAYYAWIECQDGTLATSIHNGYDHFRSDEFTTGLVDPAVFGASRRLLAAEAPDAEAEHNLKREVGHPRPPALNSGIFGFTLMNCDSGDLRPAPGGGVWVYDETGRHGLIADGPTGTEVLVDELYRAVVDGQSPLHDGSWGLACLELCLAIRESQQTGAAVELTHQGKLDPQTVQETFGERRMETYAQ